VQKKGAKKHSKIDQTLRESQSEAFWCKI